MKLKLEKKLISKNDNVVYLEFLPEDKINFKSGQFLMLDNGQIKRAYSIASSPLDENIGFYIKQASENGLSKFFVKDIKIGDEVDAMGPFGHMKLQEGDNFLLLSTGSGLGPILSIYRTLLKQQKFAKIVNIFGEKYEDDIVKEILDEMKNYENNNIKNIFYLSREEKNGFEKGHIQSSFEQAINFLGKNTKVYMCGKPVMVDESIEKLKSFGIDEKNIFFEKF